MRLVAAFVIAMILISEMGKLKFFCERKTLIFYAYKIIYMINFKI